jgi:hypothetical protein
MNGLLAGMVATCSRCSSYDIWVSMDPCRFVLVLLDTLVRTGSLRMCCILMTRLEPSWLCTWDPVWWVGCYRDSLRRPNLLEKVKIFEEYFMVEMENNWVGRLLLYLYTFLGP